MAKLLAVKSQLSGGDE